MAVSPFPWSARCGRAGAHVPVGRPTNGSPRNKAPACAIGRAAWSNAPYQSRHNIGGSNVATEMQIKWTGFRNTGKLAYQAARPLHDARDEAAARRVTRNRK